MSSILESKIRDCHCWSDYRDAVEPLSKKDKGDSFEALTKHYLELEPVHGSLLRHVWNLNKGEVPTKVRKHLNLPTTDEGIDLIAETREGHYWAIQCKYRSDESSSLSRKELSTFTDLAYNVCRNVDFALVSTTAERRSHKFDLYEDKVGFCAGDIWRGLGNEFFSQVRARVKGRAAKLTPKEPRPHQRRAMKNAQKHFIKQEESRGKMIMPCGSGKSLAAYWIAEKLAAKRILIAVPSLALIRQTVVSSIRLTTTALPHIIYFRTVLFYPSQLHNMKQICILTQCQYIITLRETLKRHRLPCA